MANNVIYLDSAASTKPSETVLRRFLDESAVYANPSSPHEAGRQEERALEKARVELLRCFGLEATHQAIFLSGATEANNLALKGIAYSYQNRGKKILVSSVEHPSVLAPARYLASCGFDVIELPVDKTGRVSPKALQEAMDNNVILVSIMAVHNETGAINDLSALAKIVHGYPKAFFHSDITQALGKTDIPFKELDLFSFSSHKIHGLKGSGALIAKKAIRFVPLLHGGGQENGFRSGTSSVPLSSATLLAVTEALKNQKTAYAHARELWDALVEGLKPLDVTLHSTKEGSPFVCHFSLNHHKASVIVEALSQKGIYVSSLSACSSKKDKPSESLLAMGASMDEAANGVRVSFDESNSLEEIHVFVDTLATLLQEVHPR